MTTALRYAPITVHDVDEALAFYRDALDLEVRNDVANGGFRWVTLGFPGDPVTELVLSVPHAGRSQADGDAMQSLLAKGLLPAMIFVVDDLDATFDKAVAAGGEVLQEPVDQSWGPRDCAFRDPSGNAIRINQR